MEGVKEDTEKKDLDGLSLNNQNTIIIIIIIQNMVVFYKTWKSTINFN